MPELLNTTQAVVAALETAAPYSAIWLDLHSPDTDGGDYAPLKLPRGKTGPITLVGRRSASEMTTFEAIEGTLLDGISFVTLGVRSPKVKNAPGILRLEQCSNIALRDVLIDGVDMTPHGVHLARCRGIEVEEAEVINCWMGLTAQVSKEIIIRNSEFHELRTDGVHGVWEKLRVEGCDFHDFHPQGRAGTGGDHADAVQSFTTGSQASDWDNYDATTGVGNPMGFEIADCRIWRGSGAPMQGVFFSEEVGSLPFGDVAIRQIGAFGTLIRSISVRNALAGSRLTIDRCETVSWPHPDNPLQLDGRICQPGEGNSGGGMFTITNCAAQKYQDNPGGTPEGCILLDEAIGEVEGLARQDVWLASHPR
jgi:hypothetical protein